MTKLAVRIFKILEIVVIAVIIFVCSDNRLYAYEYEVDGVMEDIPTPAGMEPFSYNMKISVKNCQWAVFEVQAENSYRIITELSDDGTNVHRLTHMDTNVGGIYNPSDLDGVISNSWSGEIHPTGFPYRMMIARHVIMFYAYGSSCYFDSISNQMVGSIIFSPDGLKKGESNSQALVMRNDSQLQLPTKISFMRKNGKMVEADFIASNFTNTPSGQLPMQVEVMRYYDNSTNVLQKFVFHATRIAEKNLVNTFDPEIPKQPAIVTDYRFSK